MLVPDEHKGEFMRSLAILAASAFLVISAPSVMAQQAPAPPTPAPLSQKQTMMVQRLQASALQSRLGYEVLESLTTEIGPRLAGSPEEARARDWAVAKLKALGFENVRVEPFTVPYWRRQIETAAITSPAPQKLYVTALGGSGPTPPGGLEAEVVGFPDMAALRAAPDAVVKGKIVFIDERTVRTQDGSGYGVGVAKRAQCQIVAQGKGAAACVIRSVGTDSHRFPHAGGSSVPRDGINLPNAAVSAPDADQIARLLARGPVKLRLEITVERRASAPSGNVIAEIRGATRPEEVVVIGGHLDSWDLGTGALDDGAGVAIATAAAKLIRDLPVRPARTIRVVLWGSEETGLHGGRAYAAQHKDEAAKHIVAAESDFGAGRIWRLETDFGPMAAPYALALQQALAPLAINPGPTQTGGGPDIGPLKDIGVPVVELAQDGRDYFDYHHTPDDTLDKVDPAALAQNIAAYATFAYLAADSDWDFRAGR